MSKNLLIGQSGGPTAAINASLAGAVARAMKAPQIGRIFGAHNGMEGILKRDLLDLSRVIGGDDDLRLLKSTPAMALGSCRLKLPDPPNEVYEKLLGILNEFDVGYFLYIGGNDSMDTVGKLSAYFRGVGADIKAVGVPKTIDNDLCETDHTPGFGSAAKYIATSVAEIARDSAVYDAPSLTVVEIMGRSAGWLTAAASLARLTGCGAPHLIYLPEVVFDPEKFISDVKETMKQNRHVVVAASEGLRLANGAYAAEEQQSGKTDAFGHKYLSGIGKYLERLAGERLHCKVRSVELNVLQRAAAHLASAADLDEACGVGAAAVEFALEGDTGAVAVIKRISDDPYAVRFVSCPVERVANLVREVPQEFIAKNGCDVTPELLIYLRPLIKGEPERRTRHGLPQFFTIDPEFAAVSF